ncbi:NHLP leader peptide family natural product precursor [Paenibacillus sp. MY03]|uniref:NHLP leader peptide family RiPP precursor n=1 Tax=Paenibacillus sp. MY03 TaxID=302980 RepID=UPI000B3D16B3|nr:NHLP leader peptide family RiPP precursor [Paenibacillus sp. MY03]OUS68064.1 NHLP leader peptide family natural product precursor [Paenibacillus sp. MY03]
MTDQVLKEKIISRAWEDAAFKQQLLSDPKGTIAKIFGVDIPDDVDLEAVTESSKKLYLVIPPTPVDMKFKEQVEAPMWA